LSGLISNNETRHLASHGASQQSRLLSGLRGLTSQREPPDRL
jgi:hypothetical protein